MNVERYTQKSSIVTAAISALVVFVAGCAPAPSVNINEYEGAVKADDLFIVDCLLPGQVRQLGQNYTYLSQRRPIRTSAKNCTIQGGEYVAYDRANLSTALKIWMPAAEGGDATAQNYIGEMYEQGLGVQPDFNVAAEWYKKAAAQDHSPAMINLGALYESGRGVRKDLTTAMNWYRKASGITDGTLELATEEVLARRRAQEEESRQLKLRVEQLTGELDTARTTINRRQRDLERARQELADLVVEIGEQQLSATDKAQMDNVRQENESLRNQLKEAQRLRREMLTLVDRSRTQTETAELELLRTQQVIKQQRDRLQTTEAELQQLRTDLSQNSGNSAETQRLQDLIAEKELTIVAQRRQLEQANAQVSSNVSQASQDLEAAETRELELRAQLIRREKQIQQIQAQLTSTEDQLLDTQRRLTLDGSNSDLIRELQAEIAEKESEIAQYESTTDDLLQQLGIRRSSTQLAQLDPAISVISPAVATTRGVKSVTLFANLAEYEIIGRVDPVSDLIAFRVNDRNILADVDDGGIFKTMIPVASVGDTPVRMEAVSSNGNVIAESFIIQKEQSAELAKRQTSRQFRGRLRSDLGEFHALVIGNNNYQSRENLGAAVNDATAVAGLLRDQYGYQVNLLTNATRDQMVRALADYADRLTDNDNLLIYYAGHGVLDESNGEGYWLGVDASASQDDSWIGNAQISDFVSAMKAKHVLLVADSCYSGTLSGTSIRPIPLEIDDQDLLFISRVKARTVLTSGGLQPVLDDGGDGHSIFGGAFIRTISANSDLMEGYRLFENLRTEVSNRSRLNRVPQSPEYTALKHAGHEGSEFFFLPFERSSVSAL